MPRNLKEEFMTLVDSFIEDWPQSEGGKQKYAFAGSVGVNLFLAGGNFDGDESISVGSHKELIREIGDIEHVPLNDFALPKKVRNPNKNATRGLGDTLNVDYILPEVYVDRYCEEMKFGSVEVSGKAYFIQDIKQLLSCKIEKSLEEVHDKHVNDINNFSPVYEGVFDEDEIDSRIERMIFSTRRGSVSDPGVTGYVGESFQRVKKKYAFIDLADKNNLFLLVSASRDDPDTVEHLKSIYATYTITPNAEGSLLNFLINSKHDGLSYQEFCESVKRFEKAGYSEDLVRDACSRLSFATVLGKMCRYPEGKVDAELFYGRVPRMIAEAIPRFDSAKQFGEIQGDVFQVNDVGKFWLHTILNPIRTKS